MNWTDRSFLNQWTLKMIAFDSNHIWWCVGTESNVGKWNNAQFGWEDQGLLGGWTLKMLAFDRQGTMWCVGTEGNVGKWNGLGWDDYGLLGGWTLNWIWFYSRDTPDEVYCIGTNNNLGKYEFDHRQMLNVDQNWTLKMITSSLEQYTLCVGTEGNVGFTSEL